MKTSIFAIASSVLLVACGSVVRTSHCANSLIGISENDEQCHKEEWTYNHQDPTNPPQYGIALSGGGMRSGSYAMGVLKALQERGELDDTELLSSVSGGGYTAGWYVTQLDHDPSVTPADLFRDQCPRNEHTGDFVPGTASDACRYQRHLERHSKIVSIPRAGLFFLGDFLMTPVNFLLNGAFGWHVNTTPHRWAYEYALGREFFNEPPDAKQFIETPLTSLLPNVKAKRIPFLIINTTVAIDDDTSHAGNDRRNAIFEFTPLRFGSDAIGYREGHYRDTVKHLISVSGAALDFEAITAGAAQKTIMSSLNIDLGSYRDNPLSATPLNRDPLPGDEHRFHLALAAHRFLFFPVYFFHRYRHDAAGLRVYLTDGGHSENLGAFSLIRRMCRNIVIVDASQDRDFTFDDYRILKQAVFRELGGELVVPVIDSHSFDAAKPVMRGTVKFPRRSGAPQLNIVYVKLSLDSADPSRYAERANITKYATQNVSFPFESTANQAYTPERYRAYRDLGYLTIKYLGQHDYSGKRVWEWGQ